jgi:hypothetical protein
MSESSGLRESAKRVAAVLAVALVVGWALLFAAAKLVSSIDFHQR